MFIRRQAKGMEGKAVVDYLLELHSGIHLERREQIAAVDVLHKYLCLL